MTCNAPPTWYTLPWAKDKANLIQNATLIHRAVDDQHNMVVEVFSSNEYGNMLFINGDIQISSRDFKYYHDSMVALLPKSPVHNRVLVVGDGDGGFTNRPDLIVTHVEQSNVVRIAASIAFPHICWNDRVGYYRLYPMPIEDYIKLPTKHIFDGIMIAVDDGFNKRVENLELLKNLFYNHLRSGGCLIAQVGCMLDQDMEYFNELWSLFEVHLREDLEQVIFSAPFMHCFQSPHVFKAFYKR